MVEIRGNSGNLSRVKVLQVVSLTVVLLGRAALIQAFFGTAILPNLSLFEKRNGWRLRYKNDGSSPSSHSRIGTNATESESLPVVGLAPGLFGGGDLSKRCHRVAPNGAKITMVGSGPGSPDLLTVAAHRVLTSYNANAKETLIIADRLVSKDILDICIGEIRIAKKYPGCAEQAQEDIYSWVQEGVQQGRHVIRLKIGDPFVFGRGGEEVLRFRDMCGIEPTVIPVRITSATSIFSIDSVFVSSYCLVILLQFPSYYSIAHFIGSISRSFGATAWWNPNHTSWSVKPSGYLYRLWKEWHRARLN